MSTYVCKWQKSLSRYADKWVATLTFSGKKYVRKLLRYEKCLINRKDCDRYYSQIISLFSLVFASMIYISFHFLVVQTLLGTPLQTDTYYNDFKCSKSFIRHSLIDPFSMTVLHGAFSISPSSSVKTFFYVRSCEQHRNPRFSLAQKSFIWKMRLLVFRVCTFADLSCIFYVQSTRLNVYFEGNKSLHWMRLQIIFSV